MLTRSISTRGTVQLTSGKEINVTFERQTGKMPDTINGTLYNHTTGASITVTLYPGTGKVNYSANNTSAAPADLVADQAAIKAKLIELQAEEQAIVNTEIPAVQETPETPEA